MAKIVGGVTINEVIEGVQFDCIPPYQQEEELKEKEYTANQYHNDLENHLLFECLTVDDDNNDEPFEHLAKKMFNLIPDGKIKKRVIKKGYGEKPAIRSKVNIHYNGYVEFEAQPFDSTYIRNKPFTFTIGEGGCIPGLEICVESMQISEISHFLIEPELAFKDSGLGRIPANSTILFKIEMLSTLDAAPDSQPVENKNDFANIYIVCNAHSVQGKRKFQVKDYSGAAQEYKIAIRKLEDALLNDYEDQLKSDELMYRLYKNSLICFTLLNEPKRGCQCANSIYNLAKNKTVKVEAKVYFNNAKCLRMLGDFEAARRRLSQARAMEPHLVEIKTEFEVLVQAKVEYRKREKILGEALLSA